MRKIKIEPIFYFCIAILLILVPVRLIIAWFLAITIHEMFHYIALKLYGVNITKVKVTITGAKILVTNLEGFQEVICALAGPIGGSLLLLLRRWLPCAALFGILHSCFNLLPMFSLDGGRALRVVLVKLLGTQKGEGVHLIVSYICAVILVMLEVSIFLQLKSSLVTILIPCVCIADRLIRKSPCKLFEQIVQ